MNGRGMIATAPGEFANKVAVVTGSSGGIGNAVAMAFGRLGAAVVFNGRSQSRLAKAVRLARKHGLRAAGVRADVSSPSGAVRVIDGAFAAFGRVDVLVNNAGVSGPPPVPFWRTRPADWERTLATNLTGPMLCSSAYVRRLRRLRATGRIINVSSIAGSRAFPGLASYCVSKSALRAFTECQARDLEGSGVVVVCLELDGHRTPMTRRRLAGTDYERQEPPGAAVDLFFYAATGPAELLHGRTLSEARFRADRDAEARLNSALSTCPPWLPHMPRYFSEPGPPPGALHMDFLENPAGPPPKALAGLRRSRRASLSRYPDPNTGPLRRALAQRLGLPAGCLTFGTGASELVDRVLRTFARAGDAVVTTDPTWPVFERLCTALGAGVVRVPYVIDRASATARLDLEDVLKAVDSQTRLVYLVNPNNPLGATIDEDDFRRFLARLRPHVPVVIDEAYIEYSDRKGVLRANQVVLDAGRPVIGIRTFSKFFGLAGLRIGYAFADPATTQLIARLHLPFSVSAVGQDAALAALNDRAHAERTRETIQKGRRQLRAALARLGLFALSSEASFVMAEPPAEPDRVYDALVRNGIFLPEVCWNGLMQFPVGLQNENRRYLRVLAGLKRARHG